MAKVLVRDTQLEPDILEELKLIRKALGDKMELAEEVENLRTRLSSPEEGSAEARKWLCDLTDLPADTPWPELINELCRINILGARQIEDLQSKIATLEAEKQATPSV